VVVPGQCGAIFPSLRRRILVEGTVNYELGELDSYVLTLLDRGGHRIGKSEAAARWMNDCYPILGTLSFNRVSTITVWRNNIDELNTKEASIPPNYAAVPLHSIVQEQRKAIRQVLDLACGREAGTAVGNIPKDATHRWAMIAKIDPCRVARWPTLALSKLRTANQHYGHRLLERGIIAKKGKNMV
jgi:hypothetical protein